MQVKHTSEPATAPVWPQPIAHPLKNPCFFSSDCKFHQQGCDYSTYEQQLSCSEWPENEIAQWGKYSVHCIDCGKYQRRRDGAWVIVDTARERVANRFGATPGGVFCPDCRTLAQQKAVAWRATHPKPTPRLVADTLTNRAPSK